MTEGELKVDFFPPLLFILNVLKGKHCSGSLPFSFPPRIINQTCELCYGMSSSPSLHSPPVPILLLDCIHREKTGWASPFQFYNMGERLGLGSVVIPPLTPQPFLHPQAFLLRQALRFVPFSRSGQTACSHFPPVISLGVHLPVRLNKISSGPKPLFWDSPFPFSIKYRMVFS